jgi:hypothetical protein
LSETVTNNTTAIATANQSITTITNEQLAQSTFQTNLSSTFGTFDENGNLTSLSQAFADQVLQTTASDRYANAQFVTNLAASTGTYDANGNLVTMAEAFANQVLSTTTSDKFATSTFATNLAASFGTYNPDGSIATFSEATANQILEASTTADFADAQFVTTLVSNFGTYDENGNLLTVSDSYANQVLATANTSEFAEAEFVTNLATSFGTYDGAGNLLTISSSFADDVLSTANTSEFAEASKLTNLGASFGTVNPDGSVSFDNTSTYSNEILNYVDANSSLATQVENLQTTVTNIPQTIRQPNEPDVNAYPLGSIWVDTDDNNSIYILVDGTPRTWEATTSEALGDLILSNAQLETEIDLLSDTVSSQALKTTTLTAQFGVYDPATNTFTINNNATVVSALRSYADAESAAASKVDGINSVFNIVDANGNVIKNLATFNQEITTYVDQNSAIASDVSDLTATIGDENSGLVANVQQASDAVASLTDGLKAKYAITAEAGSAISSMTLLAEDPNQPGLPANSSIVFNTGNFIIQNGSGVDQFTINTGTGKAEFSGDISAASGTFNGVVVNGQGISGPGFTLNNQGITTTNGTFSGTFTAGGVEIIDDTIKLTQTDGDFSSNILFNNSSGSEIGEIKVIDVGTAPRMYISSGNGLTVNTNSSDYNLSGSFMANGNGVATSTAQIREFLTVRLEETSGNSVYLDSAGVYLTTSNGTFFWVQDDVISCGNTTSDVILNVNGVPVGSSVSPSSERYLESITKSGNTLTFVVRNATNQTYTFGANAFTSTTIPTNNNQLTNGAGYITSSALTGYATLSYVNNNFITTTGSYSFSGSLTATDFILSSDRILKENIKEYKAKPINIQYKQYNIVGDEETRVGVIAQELEKDHPEFIRENDNGIKSVSYIDMLMAKVAELENRIKELEDGVTK